MVADTETSVIDNVKTAFLDNIIHLTTSIKKMLGNGFPLVQMNIDFMGDYIKGVWAASNEVNFIINVQKYDLSQDLSYLEFIYYRNLLIKTYILEQIKSIANELGEEIIIENIQEKIQTYWQELIDALSQHNWIKVYVVIDKLSNGFVKLKIELVKLLLSDIEHNEIIVNNILNDINIEPIIENKDKPSEKSRLYIAKEFYEKRKEGVIIAQNVTSINDGLDAFVVYCSGNVTIAVANLLAICQGDIDCAIETLTQRFGYNTPLLNCLIAIVKYIELLGNNYVNHDYTNSRVGEVSKLDTDQQKKLKTIEGVILSTEFFARDMVSMTTQGNIYMQNSSSNLLAGGIRYSIDEDLTLSRKTVPVSRIRDSGIDMRRGKSEYISLMNLIALPFEQLTEVDIKNLSEYWGLNITVKNESNTPTMTLDPKGYKKAKEFISRTLISDNSIPGMLNSVAPILKVERLGSFNHVIYDPRMIWANEILTDTYPEGELGRLIKLEPKEERQKIFPRLDDWGDGIQFEITKVMQQINYQAIQHSNVPASSVFIQPNPSLVWYSHMGLRSAMPDNEEVVHFTALVPPQQQNKLTVGMGGYFSTTVGKIICVRLDWLVEQSMDKLDLRLGSMKDLAFKVMRINPDIKTLNDAIRSIWEMPAIELQSLLYKNNES